MSKEILDIIEKVKSGKTIIYIGKDLIMMNMAKYHEYVELEEEPVSKRILQAKCEEQEKVLSILKRIIKVKPSDLYNFELVIRGTDEEENTIKEWLEKDERESTT